MKQCLIIIVCMSMFLFTAGCDPDTRLVYRLRGTLAHYGGSPSKIWMLDGAEEDADGVSALQFTFGVNIESDSETPLMIEKIPIHLSLEPDGVPDNWQVEYGAIRVNGYEDSGLLYPDEYGRLEVDAKTKSNGQVVIHVYLLARDGEHIEVLNNPFQTFILTVSIPPNRYREIAPIKLIAHFECRTNPLRVTGSNGFIRWSDQEIRYPSPSYSPPAPLLTPPPPNDVWIWDWMPPPVSGGFTAEEEMELALIQWQTVSAQWLSPYAHNDFSNCWLRDCEDFDVNGDGIVNLIDYAWLAQYYTIADFSIQTPLSGDLYPDGKIDLKDFAVMAERYK